MSWSRDLPVIIAEKFLSFKFHLWVESTFTPTKALGLITIDYLAKKSLFRIISDKKSLTFVKKTCNIICDAHKNHVKSSRSTDCNILTWACMNNLCTVPHSEIVALCPSQLWDQILILRHLLSSTKWREIKGNNVGISKQRRKRSTLTMQHKDHDQHKKYHNL